MAPQHSKTIVDKFEAAEKDIDRGLKRFENYIGSQIASMATSSVSDELRLEEFILGIRDCKELQDLRSQISASLRSCKVEICNVNSGFLKFIKLHVNADNSELAGRFGISDKLSKSSNRKNAGVRKNLNQKSKGFYSIQTVVF